MRITFIFLATACVLATASGQQDTSRALLSLIPRPVTMDATPGKFTIDEKTKIVVDKKSAVLGQVATFLADQLRLTTGYPVPVNVGGDIKSLRNAIVLSVALTGKNTGAEGYELSVTPGFARIAASTPSGVFYGMQTFFQLLPKEFEYGAPVHGVTWEVPCVWIEDGPRFPWRGMHLDVGRHFFSKQFVKKYIDLIARYKFNTFHWHLTEDQGWRIEIKKYPKLTEAGSWRKETMGNAQPHGGYYTRDDIREVVEYAQQRFVTVVPEIEMPGHSTAALAAYPELSCTGGPFQVQTVWGVCDDVYCAGNDTTFEFLQNVLGEVISLFPGPFVHIGGDECPKTRWKACPKCQARMKAEGLNNEHELQSYFIKRIEKFLSANGKRLIGWDEILEGGLAPGASVMSWRGIQGGVEAARAGHDVVMTPTSHCYFDYYQAVNGEPQAIGGFLPLERVYSYEPVPVELSSDEAKHVLGAQGNLWSEYLPNHRQVEYMAFPRACALSEVVWSPAGTRDYSDFSRRMVSHYDRLSARNVNVRIPSPTGFEGLKMFLKDTVFTIVQAVPGAAIRYTTDGSEPTEASRVVEGPVSVGRSLALRARTFMKSGAVSPVATGYLSLVDTMTHGLEYRVFDIMPPLPRDVEKRSPSSSGVCYGIGTEWIPPTKDSVTVVFKGYLSVGKEGVYTFTLKGDDRAYLFVDNLPVASDTTSEWWKQADGRVLLRPGPHGISLVCMRAQRQGGLDLQMEGPGMERQQIPAAMLRRK